MTLCAMAKAKAKAKESVYTAGVILYGPFGAYGQREAGEIKMGDRTMLSTIVRRLKEVGALRKAVKAESVRGDDRYYPSRYSIVRKKDGVQLVELDLYDE